jgi:hypothetical protein
MAGLMREYGHLPFPNLYFTSSDVSGIDSTPVFRRLSVVA